MIPQDTPIIMLDTEVKDGYYDPGLDHDYIDGAAGDIAQALRMGATAECCYQPGDGTRYGLVFVPLRAMTTARPREKDGVKWDALAVSGMARLNRNVDPPEYEYDEGGVLIVWVEHSAYPLKMDGRGGDQVAGGYVEEKWAGGNKVSAGSLALLFRTISWHLDHTYPRP